MANLLAQIQLQNPFRTLLCCDWIMKDFENRTGTYIYSTQSTEAQKSEQDSQQSKVMDGF